jgi:hypothetical protein
MNSKFRSPFPLTSRQSILSSLFFSWFLYVPATLISPVTGPVSLIHPLWVLAFYFSAFSVIRMVTDDFASSKNPALVMRMVFGPLQILAGVLIVVGGIMLGANSLWAGVSAVLWYFGQRNIAGAVYILRSQAYERAQLKRVMDRRDAFIAQEALNTLHRLERAEEARKNEEALLADLADCLIDSDPSDDKN